MDRLQLVDVLALRQMCVHLLSDDELFIDKELLGPVALSISLLTGLHVAQIPVLRFELPAPGETTLGTVRPRLLVHAQHLILPAPDLPDPYIPAAEEQSRYRQARGYLCLPVPDNPFFELVSRFFDEEEHAAEHLRYPKVLQMEAQDTCSELNAHHNVRLTTGRTARFLFDQARSLSGD